MQKKLFLGFLLLIVSGIFASAYADTVEVQAMQDFSTANPPSTITVKLLDQLDVSDEMTIESGAQVSGQLLNVVSPKRLKKNATFSFKPMWYINAEGTKINVDSDIIGKYTTTLNKGQVAKKAALSVGNHFVKGLSVGVAAIEGVVENDEGNRLKSGAKSIYNATPLSYVEKGKDIDIKINQVFYLKFPDMKETK